jgi:hypothetical protein
MLKLKLLVVFGISATALAMLAWGQEKPFRPSDSTDELGGLMRAKLASSQKVVEGLMSKDFALIRKGSEEMSKICDATHWHATDDQVYAHYRSELRRAAKKMMLLSEEKNLDGSAYTYMHSLITCINCHEYCRDVLHIAKHAPDLKVIPIPATERQNSLNRTPSFQR